MEEPPKKPTARELTEATITGAAGMVPVVGSPLAVAFAMAMGWSYNQRMRVWLEDLAAAVTDLEERGWSLDDLAENPIFTDAVINATRAAQATHQTEKLEALRNAVLHSLDEDAPTVDEQARFFRLVEEFTPAHLRLLLFLDDPGKAFDKAGRSRPNLMGGGRSHLLEDAMPEFADRRDWYDLLARDLDAASLTQTNLHVTMSGTGLWNSATTALGKRFLSFIAPPSSSA